MASKRDDGTTLISENRKARHEYFITQSWEAGIMLLGSEVKSLRVGQTNISESYASVEEGGLWLINAHIPELTTVGRFFQHEPRRKRKLLLHKTEIVKLSNAVQREGMTIVPVKMYFNAQGRAKLEIALGKGKKNHDKRDTEKKRDWDREKGRLLRDKG